MVFNPKQLTTVAALLSVSTTHAYYAQKSQTPPSKEEKVSPREKTVLPKEKDVTPSTSDIYVTLKDTGDNAINSINTNMEPIEPLGPDGSSGISINSESRTAQVEAMVDSLKTNMIESEKEIQTFLNAKDPSTGRRLQTHTRSKSFYISNGVFIKDATENMIRELKKLNSVLSVQSDEIDFEFETPTNITNDQQSIQNSKTTWGVAKLGAPSLWDQGLDGEGIIVGGIDTGVRGSHSILKANYRGDYGWFDPYQGSSIPNDQNGHGTHTMGTSVGLRGFGVAPGAKWMACKGCSTNGCSRSALNACAEFMLCPTKPDGSGQDCSKAPHVINNSWGGGQNDMWFLRSVEAWRAAGIVPVFSIGNSGRQGCGSANSPGDYPNVISVGNTKKGDEIAAGSSKGPTVKDRSIAPSVSAPGTDVESAYPSSDNGVAYMTGTSMAAPHVTGLIAIMLQKRPDMHTGNIIWYLQNHSDQDVNFGKPVGRTCERKTFPNNQFGYGIVQENNVDEIPYKNQCLWKSDQGGCLPKDICYWSWSEWQCTKN